MNTWLFLEAQLRFSDRLRVITTRRYFADMQVEDNDLYHGMFFVSAPPQINPGEVVTVQMVCATILKTHVLSSSQERGFF